MSNDTVMIRLQKDTYGRDFNLESGSPLLPVASHWAVSVHFTWGMGSNRDYLDHVMNI